MRRNLLLLAGISTAWAVGYLFIGAADRVVPPVTGTAAMTLVAALVMVPLTALLGRPLLEPLKKRLWVPLVMALTAIGLPNLAVVAAERSIPADLAALLGTTVPVFTLVLTTFVTRETRLSALRILGIAVALGGLVIFVGPESLLHDRTAVGGILTMMAGGMVFAGNGVFAARQTEDLDDCALATWTIVFGGIFLAVFALLVEDPLGVPWTSKAVASLAAEGIVGMGLAYLGYYVLVARAGAWFASLYAFLVPPIGVLAGVLVLGHPLTAAHGLGLAVVLTGLYLLTRRAPA